MRVTLAELRGIINNVLVEDAKPQASADDPLGQYAFATHRRDDDELPPEEDTAVEKRLHTQLAKHFNDNEPVDGETTALAKSFLQKGLYKQVFKSPPPNTFLYRGMMVTDEWIKQQVGMSPKRKLPKKGVSPVSIAFKPRAGDESGSSWTFQKGVALGFAMNEPKVGQYAVILHARVSDNPGRFLAGEDGMYNVYPLNNFEHEEEALALGPIYVFQINWMLIETA